MKLRIMTIIVVYMTAFSVPMFSLDISINPYRWLFPLPKRTIVADNAHIYGELAYFSHELAYDSYDETLLEKNGDSIANYIDSGGFVYNGGLKASWGRLTLDQEHAIVLFRGTNSFGNLWTDLKHSLVKLTEKTTKIGVNCKVHSGFITAYKEYLRPKLRLRLTNFLRENVNDKKIKTIILSGHSLGGALATLMAYDLGVYLKSEGHGFEVVPKILLVTFGSPRVGDACFSQVINELGLAANTRVVYKSDSITGLPFKSEYVHVGTEYNFESLSTYKAKKLLVDESKRTTGYTGAIWDIAKNTADHLKYKEIDKQKLIEAVTENRKSNEKRKLRKLK